jgi:hypothetical protein
MASAIAAKFGFFEIATHIEEAAGFHFQFNEAQRSIVQ